MKVDEGATNVLYSLECLYRQGCQAVHGQQFSFVVHMSLKVYGHFAHILVYPQDLLPTSKRHFAHI